MTSFDRAQAVYDRQLPPDTDDDTCPNCEGESPEDCIVCEGKGRIEIQSEQERREEEAERREELHQK